MPGVCTGYEAVPGKGLKCMVSGVEGIAAPGEGDIFNTTKNIVRQEFVHASKSLQQRDIEYQVSQSYTLYCTCTYMFTEFTDNMLG